MERNFSVISEDFRWHLLSWHTRQQSLIIHEPLQKCILEGHQHGIIEYLIRNLFPIIEKQEEQVPKVLTMFLLSAGFTAGI